MKPCKYTTHHMQKQKQRSTKVWIPKVPLGLSPAMRDMESWAFASPVYTRYLLMLQLGGLLPHLTPGHLNSWVDWSNVSNTRKQQQHQNDHTWNWTQNLLITRPSHLAILPHMCMCVCICTQSRTCTYMHTHTHTHTHACIHMRTHMYTHKLTFMQNTKAFCPCVP